jgi:dihydrofolate reductase
VVVTRDRQYALRHEGVECAHSLDEALDLVAADDPDTVWLIGGESLYRALLAHCDRCFVTRNRVVVAADAFFPDLDADPSWELESVEEGGETSEGVRFDFATYRNVGQRR